MFRIKHIFFFVLLLLLSFHSFGCRTSFKNNNYTEIQNYLQEKLNQQQIDIYGTIDQINPLPENFDELSSHKKTDFISSFDFPEVNKNFENSTITITGIIPSHLALNGNSAANNSSAGNVKESSSDQYDYYRGFIETDVYHYEGIFQTSLKTGNTHFSICCSMPKQGVSINEK